EGPGARGDVPELRVVRVDSDRPGVVAVAAVVRAQPGLAGVAARRRAAAAGLVGPTRHARVPSERVHVGLRSRTMVLPGRAAVARAHQAAELDADEEQVAVVGARRDPAHVRGPRPRREAPGRPGGQLEQRLELAPALAAEEAARLGPGVDGAVDG